ncbi:antitoxin VapB family protein [Candidatus Woesearchaeota archaeon]|nr:antitoxin VapB family protein [Candidatus Woesearchaeota archaeon]
MATKTISIMDDVYDRLIALKRADESFSDELRRLTETKGSILEFAGIWKDMTDKDAEDMNKAIRSIKRKTDLKTLKQRYGLSCSQKQVS